MEVPKEPSPKPVQIAPAGEGLPVKVAVLPLVEVVNDARQGTGAVDGDGCAVGIVATRAVGNNSRQTVYVPGARNVCDGVGHCRGGAIPKS